MFKYIFAPHLVYSKEKTQPSTAWRRTRLYEERDVTMATSLHTGRYFNVHGSSVKLFGDEGAVVNGRWEISIPAGQIGVMGTILDCIQADVDAGNGKRLAQIQLVSHLALVLYLEGVLTDQHFDSADEWPGFIDVPHVLFYDRYLTVRIVQKELAVAGIVTADKDGNEI